VEPPAQQSLPKRLRSQVIAPGAWLGFGLTFWSIAVSVGGSYRFSVELMPPLLMGVFYITFLIGFICLLMAGKEHYIREGIRIAERSGLLAPIAPISQAPEEDSKKLATVKSPAIHLTKEDIEVLELLAREGQTQYSVNEIATATGLTREKSAYYLERLADGGYAQRTSHVDMLSSKRWFTYSINQSGRKTLVDLGKL
jgi:hypothetical protein